MTRFDEITRLKELEKKAKYDRVEHGAPFRACAARAAPWLLEAAACFQPGDAERIARIAREDLLEGCCGQCDADVDMMHRLRRAAEILGGPE
jgi:hypothetical protein